MVEPSSTDIPVSVLNIPDEPITLYTGVDIATLQHVDLPAAVCATDHVKTEVCEQKGQLLWQLVDGCT